MNTLLPTPTCEPIPRKDRLDFLHLLRQDMPDWCERQVDSAYFVEMTIRYELPDDTGIQRGTCPMWMS